MKVDFRKQVKVSLLLNVCFWLWQISLSLEMISQELDDDLVEIWYSNGSSRLTQYLFFSSDLSMGSGIIVSD